VSVGEFNDAHQLLLLHSSPLFLVCLCVLVLQTLVCHVAFSIIAVKLYLEPVLEALRMGQAVQDSRKNATHRFTQREGEETKDDPEDDDNTDTPKNLRATREGEDVKSDPEDGNDKGDVEAAGNTSGITRHMGSLQRMGALVKQALLDEGVSVGHTELKNKRRRQVWGVGIMLASSTLLLVNVTAFIMFPEKLNDTWLNVFVGGFNLDSILFNVGIMLVCGGGVKRVAAGDQAKEKQAAAPASFVPNSEASSVYHPSEVGVGQADHKSTHSLQPVVELG
jgi:hypothetical protein